MTKEIESMPVSSTSGASDGGQVAVLVNELIGALRAVSVGAAELTPFQQAIIEEHAELKRVLRGPDVVAPGPGVSSVAPTSGERGKTVVEIAGERLGETTLVRIGQGRITSFEQRSDSLLKVTLPGDATSGEVLVFTPRGVAASANTFTVRP